MARTVDLGWAMARCTIDDEATAELCVVEPESQEEDAKSLTLVGIVHLMALRDLLNESISDFYEQKDLAAGG